AYVCAASTVPPPVTLAVVSWLCELARRDPVRTSTRPCATLPESATPAQKARTAIAGNARDLAMRSSDGYGMRPCSPFAFSHRSPDEHGRYGREAERSERR